MQLRVVVIVEGHGETDGAIRILLERIWCELLQGEYIEVIPWRGKQGQLLRPETLRPVVEAAALKLHQTTRADLRRLLLILIDAEAACPAQVAPALLAWATACRADTDIACVMPNPMFETWFAAAADSLAGVNDLPADLKPVPDPEGRKLGKGWLKKQLGRKYKETVDQPRFTQRLRLADCRTNSPSFDKLCRVLEQRLATDPSSPAS